MVYFNLFYLIIYSKKYLFLISAECVKFKTFESLTQSSKNFKHKIYIYSLGHIRYFM